MALSVTLDLGRALYLGCAWVGLLACATSARAQAAPPTPIKVGRFTFGGYVQADARTAFDESFDAASDTFLIRRARLAVSGEISPTITFLVQGDLTGSPVARDIYVTFTGMRGAAIRAGQFVAPFGLERLTSSNRLEVIDRSAIGEALVGSRDVGVMVFNPKAFWGWLSYQAAIVNGTGQNVRDNNKAKDLVGRVSAALPRIEGLSVAFNATSGAQPESDRTRVGFDASYDRPRYRVTVERISQSLEGEVDRDASGLALLGIWKHPARARTDYYAGYELAARFVDIDDDAASLTARELQFGGNYYITPQVRVMSNLLVPIGDDRPNTKVRWWSHVQVSF